MLKQVIIIRKDLKMRRGKEIAQGAHASIMVFKNNIYCGVPGEPIITLDPETYCWLHQGMTKITCQVNSEQELVDIYNKALAAGLKANIVQDLGKTEFDGPTLTAVAIGPNDGDQIDKITGTLQLY